MDSIDRASPARVNEAPSLLFMGVRDRMGVSFFLFLFAIFLVDNPVVFSGVHGTQLVHTHHTYIQGMVGDGGYPGGRGNGRFLLFPFAL